MLSPSVHPNGGVYEWVDESKPMAEFPDSYKPTKKAEAMPWDKPVPRPKAVTRTPERENVIERATAYLRQCPPAVQGLGGHDALMWAARAMVTGFDLSDADALSLLWNEFNPMCSPPWNSADPREVKDFERKVRSATDAGAETTWMASRRRQRTPLRQLSRTLDLGTQHCGKPSKACKALQSPSARR